MSNAPTAPPQSGETAELDHEFLDTLVSFSRQLRREGLTVGSGDLLAFTSAVAALDPGDLMDLYWAGRSTLVHRRDHIATYTKVFRAFFLGEGADGTPANPYTERAKAMTTAELQAPESESGDNSTEDDQAQLGYQASAVATLKAKAFNVCTPEELAALRKIMKQMRLTPPRRRSRRTISATSGPAPDLRRMVRETMRTHGEPPRLWQRRRKLRHRRLILILDVSGSMSDYSRNLLQFAHSSLRASRRVEVFCFGTRLTRITRQLARRNPDDALAGAAREVLDWDGGTQIGDSLDHFVKHWGRRGLCRGGIVVICSDGHDRGDPVTLEIALQRLARLSYRIVWMNPHKGDAKTFVPASLGMMVAMPYLDAVVSGHDLNSLAEFAEFLPTLN